MLILLIVAVIHVTSYQENIEADLTFDQLMSRIGKTPLFLITKSYCGYSKKAKTILNDCNVRFEFIDIDSALNNAQQFQNDMQARIGSRTVPQVFKYGKHIGDCSYLVSLVGDGRFDEIFADVPKKSGAEL
ncbi:MAG: hypothetical protein MHMPM18_003059 [Marteilia pararefringens]